jgi:Ca2+-dependent lipid-binding protein
VEEVEARHESNEAEAVDNVVEWMNGCVDRYWELGGGKEGKAAAVGRLK